MSQSILQIISNFLSSLFEQDIISSEVSPIWEIPCENYQKSLVQEFICSKFFENPKCTTSILTILSELTVLLKSQPEYRELLVFYFESLDILFRRSLANFSDDEKENLYICNNYTLQFQAHLPYNKQLIEQIFILPEFNMILDQLLLQLSNNDQSHQLFCLSLLQPLMSLSFLCLSYSFSQYIEDPLNNNKKNNHSLIELLPHDSKMIKIGTLIAQKINEIRDLSEETVFKEWLSGFFIELYRLFNIILKIQNVKSLADNALEIYKTLFANTCVISQLKSKELIKFVCKKENDGTIKVNKLLENKYKAYIFSHSIALDIEYYILKQKEGGEKKFPVSLDFFWKACIVFHQTPKSNQTHIKMKHRGKNRFQMFLGRFIRTIISMSNDENGFIVIRAFANLSDWLAESYHQKQKFKDGEDVENHNQKLSDESIFPFREILLKGTFSYMLLLDVLEWSIEAMIDFLLDNYFFLELLFQVLKRITSHTPNEISQWLEVKEADRIVFFTEELVKRVTDCRSQFSFNVSPLINLLGRVVKNIDLQNFK